MELRLRKREGGGRVGWSALDRDYTEKESVFTQRTLSCVRVNKYLDRRQRAAVGEMVGPTDEPRVVLTVREEIVVFTSGRIMCTQRGMGA